MLQSTTPGRRLPSWARDIGREVSAFGAVGALAFVVETASFNALAFGLSGDGPLRSSPLLASGVGTLLAMLIGWFGNRYWTYRERREPIDPRDVAWFVGVNLLGLTITAAPVYFAHQLFGPPSEVGDNLARLIGWAAATSVRFLVYRGMVFRRRDDPATILDASEERSPRTAPWGNAGRWPWCLALLAAACGYLVSTVFHPGYLTSDSLDQLRQAQGLRPVTDWHPPIMAMLWRLLIDATGALSAMADLQVALLWGALWALATTLWKRTVSRTQSLLMLGLGLAPQIVTFTGVVWKDVHMAYALLAVCAIALHAKELREEHKGMRRALLALGLIFLAYAILVRKNAFPAVLPMLPLLVFAIWPKPSRRLWLVTIGSLLALVAVGSYAVTAVVHPVPVRQYAQIPLDDLVHVLTPQQVGIAAEAASAHPAFRDDLVATARACQQKHIIWDAYFACYPQSPSYDGNIGSHFEAEQAAVLVRMWTQQIPHHIAGYAEYRSETFAHLLFDSNLRYVDGSSPGTSRELKVNPVLGGTLNTYVQSFSNDLPWLFQAWFWTLGALVLVLRRWACPWSRELRLLGLSSVLYVFCYLPTAPQSNFRYFYWPAIAGTLALVLIASHAIARRSRSRAALLVSPRTPPPGRRGSMRVEA